MLETAAANFRTLSGDSVPAPQPTQAPRPTEAPAPRVDTPPVSSGNTMTVECPEQGFTTVCDAAYTWQYLEGDGVYIYIEQADVVPYVYVARAAQSVGDGATYLRDVEAPLWQDKFGENMVNYTMYDTFDIGDRQLSAALFTHRAGGFLLDLLRVVDARPDRTVFYVAHYIQGEGDTALAALDMAVANFNDGSAAPAPQTTEAPAPQTTEAPSPQVTEAPRDTAGLTAAPCPELGFSTLCDPSVLQKYEDGTGLNLFIEGEERIPYVLVYQNGDLIGDAGEYLREQYTPYMKNKYGDDLVGYTEYEYYDIGGKQLPAALYTYRVQGTLVDMLRIMDSTGSQTVSYTAKYVQGNGDATMDALDKAVRYYQPDANYYD